MSEPFLAEIKIFSFNYAPSGWALCNGQLLPINQNQALFALLGTTYGGNGQTTFALPNFRGRAPVHFAGEVTLGQSGGAESHTLTQNEMPAHAHPINASAASPNVTTPSNAYLSTFASDSAYSAPNSANSSMSGTTTATGGTQPHNNMQPYLVLNFCIALQGIFTSQN